VETEMFVPWFEFSLVYYVSVIVITSMWVWMHVNILQVLF